MSEIPPRELSSAMFADFTRDERFNMVPTRYRRKAWYADRLVRIFTNFEWQSSKKFYGDSIDHNRGLLIPNSELFSKKLMKCILFWNLIWQIQDCGGKMCVYSLMLDLL